MSSLENASMFIDKYDPLIDVATRLVNIILSHGITEEDLQHSPTVLNALIEQRVGAALNTRMISSVTPHLVRKILIEQARPAAPVHRPVCRPPPSRRYREEPPLKVRRTESSSEYE